MDFTFLLLIVFVLLSIFLYFTKNYCYWKNQNVPCASNAIPGIGHALPLLLLRENLSMWIEKLYKKMGKRSMYGCYLMQRPALVIRDQDVLKSVLQTHFSSFRNNLKALNKNLDPILARNPFFAKDELWKDARVALSNNYSGKALRCVLAIVFRVCDKFTDFVDRKISEKSGFADLELKELLARVTGETAANAGFGIEGQSFEDTPNPQSFATVAKNLFATSKIGAAMQVIRFYFPKFADRIGLSVLPKEIDNYFRDNLRTIVKSRLQSGENRNDFLQFIIETMKEVDEDMALAQATTLCIDGYEAASSVMGFIIYHLAENPHIQNKAREEVHSVLEKFDNKITYEGIKNMKYLEQIMYESLRLHPVFGEMVKVCNDHVTLRGSDNLSCSLKPGDLILISSLGLHTDEEYWSNPSVFDPERFNATDKLERYKYKYIAFGEGTRMCMGQRLAIMTVKTVVAVILQHYLLEMSPKMKLPLQLDPYTFATVVKDALWVRFKSLRVKD